MLLVDKLDDLKHFHISCHFLVRFFLFTKCLRAQLPVIVFNDFSLWVRNNYPKSVCRREFRRASKHPSPNIQSSFFSQECGKILSEGSGGSYLPFAGMSRFNVVWLSFSWDVQLFLNSYLYNLINFPKSLWAHDTDIILLKVKKIWGRMTDDEVGKKKKMLIQPQAIGVDTQLRKLNLFFCLNESPECYFQSVSKVSGNQRSKQ